MAIPFSRCSFYNITEFKPDLETYEHKFCVDDPKHNRKLDLTLIEQTYKHLFLCDETTYEVFKMRIPRRERVVFATFDDVIQNMQNSQEYEYENDFQDASFQDVSVRLSKDEYSSIFKRMVMGKKTAKELNIDINDTECCICAENIKSRQHISVTKCNHVFHLNCLRTWLTKKCQTPTCPMCRADVRD